ncbi:MAG TPA: helix-turn-helix transcriptional regulator [Pseudonocardiaceae bacterium]|nr:helix-turn-helix transcriptional regulator [Pseudonocardiaceae bacterium]
MAGPTIRRVQLGIELRRLREAAGMSRPEAAAAIKTSRSRIAAIELGRNVVSYSELIVLLRDHYHGTEEQLTALEEIREEASQRGWWSTYALPENLGTYVGLESDASSLRRLDLENIPGLLQTEAYMRTLFTIDTRVSDREMERGIASRLRRQERLTGPNPLQLTAVVSEGALLRCAGDRQLAAGQLARLIEVATWPNIELRVLPFGFGLHAGMAGQFALLSFPDDLLPDIAHQEYVVGGHLIDDAAVVSQLTTVFSELRGQALGPDESLAMIAQLAEHQRG